MSQRRCRSYSGTSCRLGQDTGMEKRAWIYQSRYGTERLEIGLTFNLMLSRLRSLGRKGDVSYEALWLARFVSPILDKGVRHRA